MEMENQTLIGENSRMEIKNQTFNWWKYVLINDKMFKMMA